MSQKGSYKKITVSSHADSSSEQKVDEEVIYIGASPATCGQPDIPSPSSDTSQSSNEGKSSDTSQSSNEGKSSDTSQSSDKSDLQTSDEAHHEQTLDDLNNVDVPFQKTQRIVLIVMGLLVIAFCVYWFGLR